MTTDFFTHPKYNQLVLHNDLALVHLPYAVNFTGETTFPSSLLPPPSIENIRPICLPGHSEAGTKWDGELTLNSG